MKPAHLLDTSALLAHLLQEPGEDIVERCISTEGGRSGISVVSWVEFQLIIGRSDYSKADAQKIVGFYREALGTPLPIDNVAGKAAVTLRAQSPTRIHLTDLLIAACAKSHGLKLVYRDKHIEGIPETSLPQIKLPSK
jgi:predicted nucleic acid-binding protein